MKSAEYTDYLQLRGYEKSKVKNVFKDTMKKSRTDSRKKVTTKETKTNPVIFATKFNPRGPDIKSIINQHIALLSAEPNLHSLFPDGSIMIANKRENNFGDLLLRSDPYNIKTDFTEQTDLGYVKCTITLSTKPHS